MSKPVKSAPPQFPSGWMVFPLPPGSKEADIPGWPALATDDPVQIAKWHSERPGCGWALAVGPSGLAIVDVDGKTGEESLTKLELEHEFLPATREHSTPRGRHLIFSDPEHTLKNTASKLGPHIDTRGSLEGKAGYIVIPPTTLPAGCDGKPDYPGGTYSVLHDHANAPLPKFVADAAGAAHERLPALDVPADLPGNVISVIQYLGKDAPVAVDGNGGNSQTFEVAASLWDRGISEGKAIELMLEYYNPRCLGPWPDEDIIQIVHNAYLYPQNGFGCRAVRPWEQLIPAEALDKLIAKSGAAIPGIEEDAPVQLQYPPPRHARALRNSPGPLPWFLVDGLILGGHVNILSGDGGTGKTTLAELLAAAAGAGVPSLDKQTRQIPVLLVQMEDGPGVTMLRMDKICAALGTQADDLPIDYWCLAGHDATIAIVSDNGDWTPGPFLQVLEKKLASYGEPVFLILDNVADIVMLDETKRGAVNTFVKKILGGLCERYGTTILLIAHPSKAAMQDGSDYAGSTAWKNGVRQMLSLSWPNDERNSNRRVLKVVKSNYSKTQEIELTLLDGVFYTRTQEAPTEHDARVMDASVDAAIMAAEQGTPIQGQKRPPKWVFDEVERRVGRRPTVRELREVLNYANHAGRVRYLKGTTKRMAGFYPWDQERAAELAAEAKRHNAAVETLSKRERADA